ncbi:MAG: carbohydrate kinase [Spirochaetes bacterium]|nr:MAG: carbohydrate kinase [Spirochaetota bacterium]RKX98384.1 MAG: carbohydrate kinase [Spirochaetota bacterium]
MKNDITMIGHISRDIIIYDGDEVRLTGGPVIYSSAAAVRSGKKVEVVTRASEDADKDLEGMRANGVNVIRLESEHTTSIENIYFTPDKEKRKVTLLTRADPFTTEFLPDTDSLIYHLAGLFRGEIPDAFIPFFAAKGKVGIDAQGLLRCSEDGRLLFRDWISKRELLPLITYLKTDAAEAEILTGETDREKAAYILASWGADEIMVTHNTEVIVLVDGTVYRAPYTPANLSGRTGRGDTTFAAYLAWRLDHGPDESVRYAAALCSIKMENPGPFTGTIADVLSRMSTDLSLDGSE